MSGPSEGIPPVAQPMLAQPMMAANPPPSAAPPRPPPAVPLVQPHSIPARPVMVPPATQQQLAQRMQVSAQPVAVPSQRCAGLAPFVQPALAACGVQQPWNMHPTMQLAVPACVNGAPAGFHALGVPSLRPAAAPAPSPAEDDASVAAARCRRETAGATAAPAQPVGWAWVVQPCRALIPRVRRHLGARPGDDGPGDGRVARCRSALGPGGRGGRGAA